MIKELTLKNFRQHKDLTLHFNAGVTVIRAANEAGKSTVFEAVAYALFGARAARNSDLATWGQPENSQEVRLTFDIDGVEYRIKRNARSAEINYDGGRVSGQNDTARFCEQLLDLKPNTGARLMFVPQNEIRGTLAEGGAKTTAMIEQLAELGQVDELVEKLQQRWNTGKTDFLEQTLQSTQQQLDDAQGEFAEMPNPDMKLKSERQKADDERQAAEGKRQVAVAAVERLSAMAADLSTPVPLHAVKIGDAPTAQPVLRTPREDFERAVDEGKEAIREGEVFQVVLSQRADVECTADPFDVYRVLRTVNPSPYMYYLRLADGTGGDFSVVGSSPETLMRLTAGTLTMFPIAGSRPRGETDEADAELERELLNDPKELSEHVMLVDLGRNDLAKVCVPGTVEVETFMEVKRYSHIMHISSTVAGRIDEAKAPVDCLAAVFPAGTLSGAPKPRAIELIDQLEPARRGLYGGVVGYFDFSGNADLAIAIRTAVVHSGRASVQAGAGIVADSVPQTEYVEARNKAAAAVRAVQVANRLQAVGQDVGGKNGST